MLNKFRCEVVEHIVEVGNMPKSISKSKSESTGKSPISPPSKGSWEYCFRNELEAAVFKREKALKSISLFTDSTPSPTSPEHKKFVYDQAETSPVKKTYRRVSKSFSSPEQSNDEGPDKDIPEREARQSVASMVSLWSNISSPDEDEKDNVTRTKSVRIPTKRKDLNLGKITYIHQCDVLIV